MLFKDRLEIRNPGSLPLGWTVAKLKQLHTSVPRNLLLAEPMYQAGYIERLGIGTSDMVTNANAAGLVDPLFLQEDTFNVSIYRPGYSAENQVPTNYPPSTDQAPTKYNNIPIETRNIVKVATMEKSRKELQQALELKHIGNFRENYITRVSS